MANVYLSSKIPENYNSFCSASESNKRNLLDITSKLPFLFHDKHITSLFIIIDVTSLKNHISLA